MTEKNKDLVWHKVLSKDELPEGRVTSVSCENRTLCMSRYKGKYGALDNKCPQQGGPLGEGSIENGLLRCPWHGWDYDPITGKAPGFDDGVETFPLEEREDGIYFGLPQEAAHINTVGDLMMETMTNWGVKQVFGMVGHSNLGVADALRIQEEQGRLSYYGIRHEGAAAFACSAYGKLTGKPAACLAIAGPGAKRPSSIEEYHAAERCIERCDRFASRRQTSGDRRRSWRAFSDETCGGLGRTTQGAGHYNF